MHELAVQLKQQAQRLGFDLVGITSAEPSRYRDYLQSWLSAGNAGKMDWLTRRFDERVDPATYFPGVKSIICVAVNYHAKLAEAPADPSVRIARYALGDDYHTVLKDRLHELADWLRKQQPEIQTRCAVDTAPLMEKELAARAGIGWLGKNTCIIHPRVGSWLLLGEILTTAELPPDVPAVDRCGTCRRCIDACPTQAITSPYQLDARRCISYLTIELRDDIPPEFRQGLNEWAFGCDICQEVCPWNYDPPSTTDVAFQPRFPSGRVELQEVLNWDQPTFAKQFRNSAVRRVKLPILQRNAALAATGAEL